MRKTSPHARLFTSAWVAGAVALLLACTVPNPQAKSTAIDVANKESRLIGGLPVPPGHSNFLDTQEVDLYNHFAAAWIAQAPGEEEAFERAARIYGDIGEQYWLRTSSGYAAKKAREELLPMMRARLAEAPRLDGRYYLPLTERKAEFSTTSFPFVYRDKESLLMLARQANAVSYRADLPKQYAEKAQHRSSSMAGAIMNAGRNSRINAKPSISRVVFAAYSKEDVVLSLSPSEWLSLRQASRYGTASAEWKGGYLKIGKFSCNESKADSDTQLFCQFTVLEQASAPITVRPTQNR